MQIFEVFSRVIENDWVSYNQINHKLTNFPCNFALPLSSGSWGWINSGFQIHYLSTRVGNLKGNRFKSPIVSNALSIWWFKTLSEFLKVCASSDIFELVLFSYSNQSLQYVFEINLWFHWRILNKQTNRGLILCWFYFIQKLVKSSNEREFRSVQKG